MIEEYTPNLQDRENEFSMKDYRKNLDSVQSDDEEDLDITKSSLFDSIPTQLKNYGGDESDSDEDDSFDMTKSNLFNTSSSTSTQSIPTNSGPDNQTDLTESSSLFMSTHNDIEPVREAIEDNTDLMTTDISMSALFGGSSTSINSVTSKYTNSTDPDLNISSTTTTHSPSINSNPRPSILSTLSYSYVPPAYKTTLTNGRVVELKRKQKKSNTTPSSHITNESASAGSRNHYGIPIHSLLQSVCLASQLEKIQAKEKPKQKPTKSNDFLLSEKWRPKRWVDLMGPEKTHRHLLRWLVSWSHVVFHTDLPPIPENESDLVRRDNLGRPQKKILLIHGPPGTGKTTIAHILAKQAGYDVLEVNASDERSGQIVREKITTAVESHRIDRSRKPVCIIADEIEGAAESGFIRVLMDLVSSDQKAMDGGAVNSNSKRKKKNKSRLLLRPIIAVCNDVYASSLRNLRPFAEVVHYTKSPTGAIVTRLRDICSTEGIKLDTSKLTEIVNTADGDLRSSLNMLQFGRTADDLDEFSDSVFHKDINQSWTKVTNRIFKRREGQTKQDESQKILKEIHTNGEYDKMVNGCFSLYPNVQYHDDMVCKPAVIGDWLYFYERLNSGIYGSQHAQLGEYLGHPLQAFYENFSSLSNTRDQIVHTDYDIREAQMANKQLSRDILESINPHTRQIFTLDEVSSELSPYALKIISPVTQSTISSGIRLKGADKERILNGATAMVDLNLRFFKDKLESGAVVYRIDP